MPSSPAMSYQSLSALETFFEASLADEQAQAFRERVAREIPQRLAENGLRLAIHHQLTGDEAGLGFATATEMVAELSEGATQLFAAGLWYPGAALVRQIIECVYLLSLMAERREEAKTWMTARAPKSWRDSSQSV
jgi:hypothetical protein